MPITVKCPSCGGQIKAPDEAAGRKVKCPKCAAVLMVPAAGATQEAVQATPPAPAATPPAAAPPPMRASAREERQEDWDDAPAKRRRDRDRDDYDDDRSIACPAQAGTNGLAIAGMVLGIVGVLLAFIPCAGWILAIIMGIVGATLSGIGLASANKLQSGKGMAISGLVLSILAIIWGPAWFFIYFYAAANAFNQALQQAAQQNPQIIIKDKGFQFQPIQPIDPNAPPTPASGKITLNNGQATMQGNLALNDPKDRARANSVCKVFTIAMIAGKTYVIDMLQAPGGPDPYLRLEDSAGKQLDFNDDGGDGLNARIIFNCTQAGEYRIVATTFAPATGNFTLQVKEQ